LGGFVDVVERARGFAEEVSESGGAEGFRIDQRDFLSARELGEAVSTRIEARSVPMREAAEVVNRSFPERGEGGRFVNVISPVVMPNRRGSIFPLFVGIVALLGLVISSLVALSAPAGAGPALALVGPHLWLLLLLLALFGWYRRSVVMVPDGCKALITRFGKLEQIVDAGRVLLFSPWKRVSYVVNTVREYPYNAPIREAPTSSRVDASVDLFLQFRIEDPAEFIFTLGGVQGFSDKLKNAISEVTRTLIYGQRAEEIYDLVGEESVPFLESLNRQFLPAVRFVSANITHAEPSSREYRMDLAAPEMVRVAKEAYTYEYELKLKKEQNEGALKGELAALRETLSAVRAEIATYQAQIDTARERETNRANARARERMVEAESEANANAALLEAQALDIRAVSGAGAPEILEHRFRQEVLDRLEEVADRLPRVIQIGDGADGGGGDVDFLEIARRMIGAGDDQLYTPEDMRRIREHVEEIRARIRERAAEIERLSAVPVVPENGATEPARRAETATEDRVEEIRRSVTDEAVLERVERMETGGQDGGEVR
jgi:regulator of protease activity HflC (stomatin/prohibitin superfamily)